MAGTDRDPEVRVVVSYAPDDSRAPRAGSPERKDDVYWASIAVNAATLRHVAGDGPTFEVRCPSGPPEHVAALLADAGVEVVATPFTHRPPDDFFLRFLASLYMLDTTAAVAEEVADDTLVLFVDPDVVWVADPAPMIAAVHDQGVVAYDLAVPPDLPVGRLTRRQELDLFEAISGQRVEPLPPHFGGEFYGLRGARLREFVAATGPVWDETLRRYERGQLHHNLEEHVFDAVLWQLGVHEGRGNGFIERIMTLPEPFGSRRRYRPELVAWHLPSEKTMGIAKVFDHLVAGRALPALDAGYHAWMRRRMGIDPTPRHLARDFSRWLKWTVTGEARAGRARGQVGIGL